VDTQYPVHKDIDSIATILIRIGEFKVHCTVEERVTMAVLGVKLNPGPTSLTTQGDSTNLPRSMHPAQLRVIDELEQQQ
jgi:hypothetical protein